MKLNSSLEIYIPKLEDYWYEQKIQSDPDTMSYNAGWNVSYDGYHYDTGCIDFPKDKWEDTFNKRINENKFFAYLKDTSINEYVGYINYHYNNIHVQQPNIYYMLLHDYIYPYYYIVHMIFHPTHMAYVQLFDIHNHYIYLYNNYHSNMFPLPLPKFLLYYDYFDLF